MGAGTILESPPGVDPAAPAHYGAFDLLQHPTRDATLQLPLSTRRELLTAVLDDALAGDRGNAPKQATSPSRTTGWPIGWPIEGFMIKAAASRYRLGTRGRGWLKRRATHTIDLEIGGVTGTLARPRTLLLGHRIGARVLYVGHTTPLSDHASVGVAELLTVLGVTKVPPMWPWPLPARWVGFHQDEPLQYLPVRPIAPVEVLADHAFEHGRYRHSLRLVRIRPDVA